MIGKRETISVDLNSIGTKIGAVSGMGVAGGPKKIGKASKGHDSSKSKSQARGGQAININPQAKPGAGKPKPKPKPKGKP